MTIPFAHALLPLSNDLLAGLDGVVDSLVLLTGNLGLEVEVNELGLVGFSSKSDPSIVVRSRHR